MWAARADLSVKSSRLRIDIPLMATTHQKAFVSSFLQNLSKYVSLPEGICIAPDLESEERFPRKSRENASMTNCQGHGQSIETASAILKMCLQFASCSWNWHFLETVVCQCC
ncbi:hypothetical protein TNCV_1493771 [Trichonephila clavipes]|nr:hypothetical protein TNCV_1493771 [Trichonephila clavipes]